jgi:hypothetical protein
MVGDEGMRHLGRALANKSSARKLELGWNAITPKGALELSYFLQPNTGLEFIALYPNNAGYTHFKKLIERNKDLNDDAEEIDVGGQQVYEEVCTALAKKVAPSLKMRNFSLAKSYVDDAGVAILAKALQNNTGMELLNLTSNSIGDEGAIAIATFLLDTGRAGQRKKPPPLKVLDLSNNQIGDEGALALAHAIAAHPTLLQLDLNNNLIGDDGVLAIAEAIGYVNKKAKGIKGAAVGRGGRLRALLLRNNSFGEEGAVALLEALAEGGPHGARAHALEDVDLSMNAKAFSAKCHDSNDPARHAPFPASSYSVSTKTAGQPAASPPAASTLYSCLSKPTPSSLALAGLVNALGKTRSLRRLSVWLDSVDDASAMAIGRVLCARSKQQQEKKPQQAAPSISDGGLESLFVLTHAVSSTGVQALLQCADEHASLRALHLVANIVHDDQLLLQQWYPHGSIIDDEEEIEGTWVVGTDGLEDEDEDEDKDEDEEDATFMLPEDPLEAELVAETIGASRGARDENGEREEWATKEGVGKKYDSKNRVRVRAARRLPEVVVHYGRRWSINHIFGLPFRPASGRGTLRAPSSLVPSSPSSCSASSTATAAAAAAPPLPCTWVEPPPLATTVQGTLFSPSVSPPKAVAMEKDAPEAIVAGAAPSKAPSTQSRIASLANKRALAKELSRKSKMQTMRKRHATQSLYVLLYDELLSYANFSALRANMSTAALDLQHAAHYFPPSRSEERIKAMGAAVTGSEALVGVAVWDRSMGGAQLGTLGSSLTISASISKGRTNRGVQMLSVRGQLNRSETDVQAQQWADRAGFVAGCAGMRQLDLSHGGLGSRPDDALRRLGVHLGKIIFPPPPMPPAPAPAKKAKPKKKKAEVEEDEAPKKKSKKAIERREKKKAQREQQQRRETLPAPNLLPLSLLSLNLRNNSITEKGVDALTEELTRAATRCKAEWKRDREMKEAKLKKEKEEKEEKLANGGKGGEKEEPENGKNGTPGKNGAPEPEEKKNEAAAPPPPVFTDPPSVVDLSTAQPLLRQIDLALNPNVPEAALQRLKEAIWGHGDPHCAA